MATPSNRSIVLFVEPYQIYAITVRASNGIGTGNYSRALVVQAMTFRKWSHRIQYCVMNTKDCLENNSHPHLQKFYEF